MATNNSPVNFVYVDSTGVFPENPNPNSIYFLEAAQQLYVGSHLIADHTQGLRYMGAVNSVSELPFVGSINGDTYLVNNDGLYIFNGSTYDRISLDVPPVDPTLSQSGQAADAKVTGENISVLSLAVNRNADGIVSIREDIAPSYNENDTYIIRDLVIAPDGGLYRCTTEITEPEAWDPTHWTPTRLSLIIYDNIDVLTSAVNANADSIISIREDVAPSYNANDTYAFGDVVIAPDGGLYRCTEAISEPEAWNPTHWTPTRISTIISVNVDALSASVNRNADNILNLRADIAEDYNPNSTYAKGDLVINTNDHGLYRCNTNITVPESWDVTHWDGTRVSTELILLENKIYTSPTGLNSKAPVITSTASGEIATFSDAADGMPLKSLTVNVDMVQAGSGNPSPTNVRPISGWTTANVAVTDTMPNSDRLYAIEPIQSGSGDPSPTNVRPITPGLTLTRDDSSALDVYGGTLDVNSGVLTVDSAIVDLGTLTWAPHNTVSHLFLANIGTMQPPATTDERNTGLVCETYKLSPITSIANAMPDLSMLRYTTRVFIRDFRFTDANDFKASVSGVHLVYPLATPVVYQLTPQEVVRALAALEIVGQTYTISFPSEAGTVYGGTLDVVSGVLTVDKLSVDMGTLAWVQYPSNINVYYTLGLTGKAFGIDNMISEMFSVSGSPVESLPIGKMRGVSNNIAAYFALNVSTVQDFVNAVTGQTLVYELATPVVYQLTPQEITTLFGANNIWADIGDVSLTYCVDTKQYIDERIASISTIDSDWNASEGTAGYIKNRPFYEEVEQVAVSITFENVAAQGDPENALSLYDASDPELADIDITNDVRLTVGSTEIVFHPEIIIDINGIPCWGNDARTWAFLAYKSIFPDEPEVHSVVVFVDLTDTTAAHANDTFSMETIAQKTTIQKLDKKFLPPMVSDVKVNDESIVDQSGDVDLSGFVSTVTFSSSGRSGSANIANSSLNIQFPYARVTDVAVNGSSVVNNVGVAQITIPTIPEISAGTTAYEDGVTPMTNGAIYLQYE